MAKIEVLGIGDITLKRLDDERGTIVLRIEALDGTTDGTVVEFNVGCFYDDAADLREKLARASDAADEMTTDWQDLPDWEGDGYVAEGRDGYYVKLEGTEVGTFPTKDIATYELAAAMTNAGCFPNVWFQNERGNVDDIGNEVRAFHDEGGTDLLPLEGVIYEEGDEIIVDGNPYVSLVKDYGTELGIAYVHPRGYGGDGNVRHAEHSDVEVPLAEYVQSLEEIHYEIGASINAGREEMNR